MVSEAVKGGELLRGGVSGGREEEVSAHVLLHEWLYQSSILVKKKNEWIKDG